jgi:hypothetical protein
MKIYLVLVILLFIVLPSSHTLDCSIYTSCDTCNSETNCGWCPSEDLCMEGDANGPTNSSQQCLSDAELGQWTYSLSNCKCLNATVSVHK